MLYGSGACLFTVPLKHDKDLLLLRTRVQTIVEFENELKMSKFVSLDAFIEGKWVSHQAIRDLASRPRGVEKGASLPPVLMVGMNKQS